MRQIVIVFIKAYQAISDAVFPKTCRFYPSCSQYTIDAVNKYGIARGLAKGSTRIVRCSPLSRGGYDPA